MEAQAAVRGYGPLCPPWRRHWLDPFILFLIFKFKFKFIDCEKTKFKFKFIDFEKSKFKFKFKFKFIDFARVEFKFKFKFINNSWADSNSKSKIQIQSNPTNYYSNKNRFNKIHFEYLNSQTIWIRLIMTMTNSSKMFTTALGLLFFVNKKSKQESYDYCRLFLNAAISVWYMQNL